MRALLTVLILLAYCSPAHGQTRRVLCYGDSLTSGTLAESYPKRLAAMRPDLEVVNGGLPGDTTDSLPRLRTLLADHAPIGATVILMGINDPLDGTLSDPRVTVRRLLALARTARHAGSAVLLLTLPPTSRTRPPRPDFDFNAYGDAVSRALLEHSPRVRGGIQVADLRSAFEPFRVEDLTLDGFHPNEKGGALIAEYVSKHLPLASRELGVAGHSVGG